MHSHLLLAALVTFTLQVDAGPTDPSGPPERITPEGKVDKLMAAFDRTSPGAAIAVTREGRLVFAKGYGQANLEDGVAISSRSEFYLASAAKQFTAFAIALLATDGKISLDDPIQDYFPELKHLPAPITIRQLVHHTSGLRDWHGLLALSGKRESDLVTQDDLLDLIFAQRDLNFPPGTETLYSNSGYTLLATLIERATGMSFANFLETRVFKPIGMRHTFVVDHPGQLVPGRVIDYESGSGGRYRHLVRPFSAYGSGGIYSSAEDLARWLLNFETRRVGREALALMYQRGELASGQKIEYSFGLDRTVHRNLELIGHDGSHGGYRTWVGRVPEQRLGIIVLGNLASFDECATTLGVLDAFLAPDVRDTESPISVDHAADYAGTYAREDGSEEFVITVDGETLYSNITGSPVALQPRGGHDFWMDVPCTVAGSVRFEVGADGEVEGVNLLGATMRRMRPSENPWVPGHDELATYAGHYRSPELDAIYAITVDGDHLVARHGKHEKVMLTPHERDRFAGDAWYFRNARFERNAQGAPSRIFVSGFRVLNVRFERLNDDGTRYDKCILEGSDKQGQIGEPWSIGHAQQSPARVSQKR